MTISAARYKTMASLADKRTSSPSITGDLHAVGDGNLPGINCDGQAVTANTERHSHGTCPARTTSVATKRTESARFLTRVRECSWHDVAMDGVVPAWDRVHGPPSGEDWQRSDAIALRTRPCPDCNGHQRLLVWFDEGGDGLWLECEDCEHSWTGPDRVGDVTRRVRTIGPVRDGTVDDISAAGWNVDDFYLAECWWSS
jgi:hypothetical protein